MPAYRITVDREACSGIFACLTRDPRFVEAADGLVAVDPDADPASDGTVTADERTVVAEFDDDRIDEARQAAAACPPGAIVVEEPEATAADGANEEGEP